MIPEDWLRMAADLLAVRDMNAIALTLRRGGTTLPAQMVRVARQSNQARPTASASARQTAAAVVVLGAIDLDIQPLDRFTVYDVLYEVTFVRPNRRAATVAEAQAIE